MTTNSEKRSWIPLLAATAGMVLVTVGALMVMILGALFVVSFLPKVEVQAGAGHH